MSFLPSQRTFIEWLNISPPIPDAKSLHYPSTESPEGYLGIPFPGNVHQDDLAMLYAPNEQTLSLQYPSPVNNSPKRNESFQQFDVAQRYLTATPPQRASYPMNFCTPDSSLGRFPSQLSYSRGRHPIGSSFISPTPVIQSIHDAQMLTSPSTLPNNSPLFIPSPAYKPTKPLDHTPFDRHFQFIPSPKWDSSDPFISPVIRNGAEAAIITPDQAHAPSPSGNEPRLEENSRDNIVKSTPFLKKLLTGLPSSSVPVRHVPHMSAVSPQIETALDLPHSPQAAAPPVSYVNMSQYNPSPPSCNSSTDSPTDRSTAIHLDTSNVGSSENGRPTQSVTSSITATHTPCKHNNPLAHQEIPLSPLTPLPAATPHTPETDNENMQSGPPRVKRKNQLKRPFSLSPSPSPLEPRKRTRLSSEEVEEESQESSDDPSEETEGFSRSGTSSVPSASSKTKTHAETPLTRNFPRNITVHPQFPLLFRRFPASTFFINEDNQPSSAAFKKNHPGGTYNPPRDAFDLYTPRFVKGKGKEKVGLCPICIESVERGGEGKKVWLSMKFSAFKCYHMQYGHGISAVTASPFSPPMSYRVVKRAAPSKTERSQLTEGKCHKCRKWIAVEAVKDVEVKVKELYWWKHAATCHKGSTIEGEQDYHVEDEVHADLVRQSSS